VDLELELELELSKMVEYAEKRLCKTECPKNKLQKPENH
jgi:hypothetical protein